MNGKGGGYDGRYLPLLRAVEDRHFWFRARNATIGAFVRRVEPLLPAGYRVLEIGCGAGNTLRVLDRICTRGVVVGMDFLRDGLLLARDRVGCALVQGDARNVPFREDVRFNLVAMFDVLEHIDDDVATLAAVRARMAPGGVLLLTVPAGPRLWSDFDVAAGHCRRYRASDLGAKLVSGGFDVEYLSPMMMALYPAAWISRKRSRGVTSSPEAFDAAARELRVLPILNEVLFWSVMAEASVLARGRVLPFGTSLIAVARIR